MCDRLLLVSQKTRRPLDRSHFSI